MLKCLHNVTNVVSLEEQVIHWNRMHYCSSGGSIPEEILGIPSEIRLGMGVMPIHLEQSHSLLL